MAGVSTVQETQYVSMKIIAAAAALARYTRSGDPKEKKLAAKLLKLCVEKLEE